MIRITNQEFRQLSDYIRLHYGIHLKEEKQALVMGRLNNVLMSKNFTSFKAYFEYIVSDRTGEAVMTLVDKITTNHTFLCGKTIIFSFSRQGAPLPGSHGEGQGPPRLERGVLLGEEPYTLAMLMNEYFARNKPLWDSQVLATDISRQILDKAQRGVYANEDIAVLPPAWRMKYFTGVDQLHSVVSDKLKKEVIFRKFNLMEPAFPFKRKFHVIFCRNVMIYFDAPTKQALVDKFYRHLEPGGYLFIGHSESLQRETTPFKYVMPAVYRKE